MPLFQAYLLNLSVGPSFTKNGPISCAAPDPTEEHPGPAKLNLRMNIQFKINYIYMSIIFNLINMLFLLSIF